MGNTRNDSGFAFEQTQNNMRTYIKPVMDRIWFVVLFVVLFVVGSYVYFSQKKPVYQSSATVMVVQNTPNQTLSADSILVTQQSAETFARIAKSDILLTQVAQELSLETIDKDAINVLVIPRTQLIKISVDDFSPTQASNIANGLVDVLSHKIDGLQKQINPNSRTALEIVEQAVPATIPIFPRMYVVIIISLFVSLVIILSLVYLLELFNTTIRSEEDIEKILHDVPVLATFPVIHSNTDKEGIDQMRVLRNNVLFRKTMLTHTLTMVSFHSKEGRTYITARLGMFLAKSGKKVLLIDADFERSGLTQMANCVKSSGLSDLLAQPESAVTSIPVTHWFTSDNNGCVDILSAGTAVEKQREALASSKIDEILHHIHDKDTYSFVLIDTPPLSESADALALAPKTHGALCIIEASRVKNNQLTNLKEEAELENFAIVGVILNKTKEKRI